MTTSQKTPPRVRCAIYTRKSTEDGLQQEFNSLDAQRESAQAYILSQRHAGWECLSQSYDDGGYTGSNSDRPALRCLLADIEAGKVDAVVVYKLDRLSRSLSDFVTIMGLFERRGVAFISTTQQFNSATSMGRLTVNLLITFAEFERSICRDRTIDKVAAARKKGKWTGGHVPLGYHLDPVTKRLTVVESEAAQVRGIFELFVEHGALAPVVRELNRRGWTSKAWVTKAGCGRVGRAFDRVSLRRLLTNVGYTGRVSFRGQLYPGEHPAIIDVDLFDRVQALLQSRPDRVRHQIATKRIGAMLAGILRCGPCRRAMTPAYSCKKPGKRYTFYTCTKAQRCGHASCPAPSVPAAQMEAFVVDRLRRLGPGPAVEGREAISDVTRILNQQWDSLASAERKRVVRLLVERVEYDGANGKVQIIWSRTGIQTLIQESTAPNTENNP